METRKVVKQGIALIVDVKTTTKLLKVLGDIFKRAQVQLILKHLKQVQKKDPVAATTEGIHLSIVEQTLGIAEKHLSNVVYEFQQLTKKCI